MTASSQLPVRDERHLTAIILCGGRGERLRPLTDAIPKPLLPANGRPILDYVLEHLMQSDVNAKGTANLADVCADAARFVYVSTSEVCGHQTEVPFVETMEPKPISPYAITKYAGELYCRMKQRMETTPRTVIVRPFNAYGPYQSSKAVIPELIMNCLRGLPIECTAGEQTREFNYVEDLVDGIVLAATQTKPAAGPINLAAGQEVPIRQLVELIARLTDSSSELRFGALPYRPTEIWRMRGANVRARELLGWEPKMPLEEGLIRTVAWFREHLANTLNPAK